jgi:hypothetical protein
VEYVWFLFAQIPITVTAAPPPGVGGAVSAILSWVYWVAWVAVAAAFMVGAFSWATGNEERGKKFVTGGVIGAIILIFWTAILGGLGG